jgi:hypothetical protein
MKTRLTEAHLIPAALVSHTMIRIQGEQDGDLAVHHACSPNARPRFMDNTGALGFGSRLNWIAKLCSELSQLESENELRLFAACAMSGAPTRRCELEVALHQLMAGLRQLN